jgi:hypothetical protein
VSAASVRPVRLLRSLLGAATIAVLGGCGGSGGGGGGGGGPGPGPGPGPGGTDFPTFVRQQFAATSDTTAPVDIDAITFTNVLSDDETLYDDVIQQHANR